MKIYTEDHLQQELVIWFTNKYCLKHHNPRSIIFSIPNGGLRNDREAAKLRKTGLLSGVSDLIIIHRGEVYFIEVKLPNKTQQPNQVDFQNRVELLGFKYILCRSLEEFKKCCIFVID